MEKKVGIVKVCRHDISNTVINPIPGCVHIENPQSLFSVFFQTKFMIYLDTILYLKVSGTCAGP